MIMIPANDSTSEERARYWMEKARKEARANRDPGGHLNYALHFIVQEGHGLEAANTNEEEVIHLTKAALIFNGKSHMEQARNGAGTGLYSAHISSAVTHATRLGRLIAPQLDDASQLKAGLVAIGTSEDEIAALNEWDNDLTLSGVSVQFGKMEARIEA